MKIIMVNHFEMDNVKKAIECGWKSLLFKSNTVFAKLEGANGDVILETTGEVKITDMKLNKTYTNEEIFENNDIIKSIEDGTIYSHDKFFVDNNNWFSLVFLNNNKHYIEDFVFESRPENLDEITKCMQDFYHYIIDSGEEGNNPYLVGGLSI